MPLLAGQGLQGGELVLHFLHGRQRPLAVGGGGLLVGGDGLLFGGGARASIKQGLRQVQAQRPQQLRGGDDVGQRGAAAARAGVEVEGGKPRGAGHANAGVGGGHGALGGGHVGAAQQEGGRHIHRDGWQGALPVMQRTGRRQAEGGGRLAREGGNGVFGQMPVALQRGAAGAGGLKRVLGLKGVGAGHRAAFKAALGNGGAAFVAFDDVVQQGQLGIGFAQGEVALRQAGLRGQPGGGQVGLAGLHGGGLGAGGAGGAPPEVRRPAGRQVQAARSASCARVAAAALLAALQAQRGPEGGLLLLQQRLGLPHAGGGSGHGLVMGGGLLHQGREDGVLPAAPPVGGQRAGGLIGADPAFGGGVGCGQGFPCGRQVDGRGFVAACLRAGGKQGGQGKQGGARGGAHGVQKRSSGLDFRAGFQASNRPQVLVEWARAAIYFIVKRGFEQVLRSRYAKELNGVASQAIAFFPRKDDECAGAARPAAHRWRGW